MFTQSQKKALLFLLAVFGAASLFQIGKFWMGGSETYDFSEFEQKFFARRDSINQILSEESRPQANIQSIASADKSPEANAQGLPLHININQASQDELTRLPRIGPAIAGRIIEYRKNNGGFKKKEDILKVKGIGKKTFEQIKDKITVE